MSARSITTIMIYISVQPAPLTSPSYTPSITKRDIGKHWLGSIIRGSRPNHLPQNVAQVMMTPAKQFGHVNVGVSLRC